MSYDISLCDPVTHETLKADSVHFIAGGIRIVGGTEKLMRYVTWNYRKFYRRNDVLGKKGIRSIYGKTGAESIPMLEKAIAALGDDTDDDDYWHATEGNAKRALYWLLEFAKMRPDGVWDGDLKERTWKSDRLMLMNYVKTSKRGFRSITMEQ